MADIYDNSPERKFVEGLKKNITAIGVKRVDFCIGYFNLRGWDQIADELHTLIKTHNDYQEADIDKRYTQIIDAFIDYVGANDLLL